MKWINVYFHTPKILVFCLMIKEFFQTKNSMVHRRQNERNISCWRQRKSSHQFNSTRTKQYIKYSKLLLTLNCSAFLMAIKYCIITAIKVFEKETEANQRGHSYSLHEYAIIINIGNICTALRRFCFINNEFHVTKNTSLFSFISAQQKFCYKLLSGIRNNVFDSKLAVVLSVKRNVEPVFIGDCILFCSWSVSCTLPLRN